MITESDNGKKQMLSDFKDVFTGIGEYDGEYDCGYDNKVDEKIQTVIQPVHNFPYAQKNFKKHSNN